MDTKTITKEKAFQMLQNHKSPEQGVPSVGVKDLDLDLDFEINTKTVTATLIRLGAKSLKKAEVQARELMKKSGATRLANEMYKNPDVTKLEANIKKVAPLGKVLEAAMAKQKKSFKEFLYYAEFEYLPRYKK